MADSIGERFLGNAIQLRREFDRQDDIAVA
jgi:hypothetical protein